MRHWLKLVVLMMALVCAGQIGDSFALGQKGAAPDPKQEENQLLAAAQRDPHNLQAVGALGEFYLRKQEWKQSALWLREAYALSGKDGTIGYDLAYVLEESGDLVEAKSLIEELEAQNDSAKLHALLAEVEESQGDSAHAAREYHRAAELEPSESNIFALATFLLQHKKYVGALEDSIRIFRYGVAQFPRSARMMVGLGVALYADNQYDEAVRTFCTAIDLDPKDQRAVQFLGRASRVSPAMAVDVDRRLKDFAERYPESAATNYFYALALWERGGGEQGQGRETIEGLLKKAESLSPLWYEPHYQLGVLYEAEQKYGPALEEMKRAVKIDDDFFPAHYQLAVLYNRSGEKAAAVREAELVKELKGREDQDEDVHDVSK